MIGYIGELISTIYQHDHILDEIVEWGAPVPFFGDLNSSIVATLGINPSIREYKSLSNNELQEIERRLETLKSLNLESWFDANYSHLNKVVLSCERYFMNRPYTQWFNRLEKIISKTNCSYYNTNDPACHIDLIPFATLQKWGNINKTNQKILLDLFGSSIAYIVRNSPIKLIIANGKTVVDALLHLTDNDIESEVMPEWMLFRRNGKHIEGRSYQGHIYSIANVHLEEPILVIGYNHNIQSSFGITNAVIDSISNWVGLAFKGFDNER